MTLHLRYAPVAFALLVAPGATAHRAPKIVEITGAPKCANCGVRLQEVANLGSYVVGSSKLEINAYAYDRKRKLAYVRGASRTEVDAYGLDGKVQFTIGFHDRRPPAGAHDDAFAMGPGDSLWVLDPNQQRVTVYSPGTASAARSFRVTTRIERILPAKDGQFVGISSRPGDAPDHALVHAFSADGKSAHRLGAIAAAGSIRPAVGLSRTGTMVWISRPDSYTIEQWGLDGTQVSAVHRDASWFNADAIAKAKREKRSRPAIIDVYEDDSGALWVSGQRPDPTIARRPAKNAAPLQSESLNVLEVLNIAEQRLEYADDIGQPLYRLGADYFVEPNVRDRVATWRVVKVSIVKR